LGKAPQIKIGADFFVEAKKTFQDLGDRHLNEADRA
jgi:hypothetical protein